MISAQVDQVMQEHLIEKYMMLPNQVWDDVISQASKVRKSLDLVHLLRQHFFRYFTTVPTAPKIQTGCSSHVRCIRYGCSLTVCFLHMLTLCHWQTGEPRHLKNSINSHVGHGPPNFSFVITHMSGLAPYCSLDRKHLPSIGKVRNYVNIIFGFCLLSFSGSCLKVALLVYEQVKWRTYGAILKLF
jgi:hypothetical protein